MKIKICWGLARSMEADEIKDTMMLTYLFEATLVFYEILQLIQVERTLVNRRKSVQVRAIALLMEFRELIEVVQVISDICSD